MERGCSLKITMYIWRGLAIALLFVCAVLVAPVVSDTACAQSEISTDKGEDADGRGDPDMPGDSYPLDGGSDGDAVSSGGGGLGAGHVSGPRPTLQISENVGGSGGLDWRLWLRALGHVFRSRLGWF